ncbi:MAG: heme lyase CcmF/NrfE family subunit [SAR202 cluster bacterium]|nr:heme lyase CcmF/NrfE family subunit [SAR202 cluster bacterium]|tara:strand:+ start:1097 stop:3088 length:1992 start_codon:yes stop_codon:yes gene_type:complete
MADLGAISLWIALALTAYSTIGSVAGKLRSSPALMESAQSAMYATVLALLVATFSLVIAFITRDFEVAYVAAHSDLAMADRFTWVAFYAGNEGSLLYIATTLSIMAALAVWRAPERFRDSLPYTTAVMMLVLTFFLAVTAVMANPFDKLPFVPADGEGINPLLTHFGMFFHPPALMAGLIGITVPFAFAIGGLLDGKTADEWVDAGRVWGIIAWVLLASGLLLGSWWAYTILGWGGFWFWDPVENAAFMPWLALTAFIHSIMVQKRRGMFRMWNIVLINVSFGLALYGMFMNRGGSIPSVHSFGESTLGWVFLLFLAVGVIVPFMIFIWRYPLLKSAQNLDSMLSREAAFLVNNLLLLAIAFVTLWGTVYPLISRLTNDEEITVARPFYDQVNGPLMLALVFLMGIGPLIPWRRAGLASVRRSLLPPIVGGLATVCILAALGLHKNYALIGFGLSAFVTTGILMEWYRGTSSRRRNSGENYGTAFLRLIWANRPRYGGYIVHLSVVMVTLGIVGASFFNTQLDVVMAPGDRVTIEGYEVVYLGSIETPRSNRTEYISTVQVFRDGALLETLRTNRDFYPNFNMASTRAAIRSTPVEDLYVVPSENLADGNVGFRILVNPLIWWMWVAGPVMVLGTVIALWPQTVRSRVTAANPTRLAPRPTAA